MLLQRKLTVRNVSLHGLSLVAAYEGSGRISVQGYQRLSLASGDADVINTTLQSRGLGRQAHQVQLLFVIDIAVDPPIANGLSIARQRRVDRVKRFLLSSKINTGIPQ